LLSSASRRLTGTPSESGRADRIGGYDLMTNWAKPTGSVMEVKHFSLSD
jgi:hypothetical protein